MSIFLTLAVYSVRVATDMPITSSKVPWISFYFLLEILFTFLALIWFVIANYLSTKNYLPAFTIGLVKALKKTNHKTIKPVVTEPVIDEKAEIKPMLNCNKCEMCVNCTANKAKEDEKKKEKSNFESYLSTINLVIFFMLLILVIISNLIVWLMASLSS
jgi:hypothetical protein